MHRPHLRDSELPGPQRGPGTEKRLPRWGAHLWMMLVPSYVLWVCLLRPLISQTELFVFQSVLPPVISMGPGHNSAQYPYLPPLPHYLQFTAKSYVIWPSVPLLLVLSHCHWPSSCLNTAFCFLTHFPISTTCRLSALSESQIWSWHSCGKSWRWFPIVYRANPNTDWFEKPLKIWL